MIDLGADGISLRFDPRIGQIVDFTVTDGGTETSPLHKAPWVGTDEDFPDSMPPHLKTLGGDFFCAPFGQETVDMSLHGWPANSEWLIEDQSGRRLRGRLKKSVNGAQLIKDIQLRPGHPFVYQRHVFVGGTGAVPVSNHANVSLPNGGIIRTSPKTTWRTPVTPPETEPLRGRSGLQYPAQSSDPTSFPSREGTVDLTRYPWFARHEDFVVGFEAPGHVLGWTAVTRPVEGDVFLSLRNADALPMTMLWHSNGGRDYPPWSGRHFGCLGVEEGAAASILGPEHGVPMTGPHAIHLTQGARVSISHVIGAIRWPTRCAIVSIDLSEDHLRIKGASGAERQIPFLPEVLQIRAGRET